jgi:hypothetical protein
MNTGGNQRPPVKLAALPPPSTAPDQQHPKTENSFSTLLKQLSGGVRKEDVKRREGWRDRSGQTHYVDYVEWHVVADLLDRLVPDWSHAVRCVVQVGDFVAVIAAITINGVTREGVGTGPADSETGIKKAEHDALKRAAVKFGIARDLYRDEEKGGESAGQRGGAQFPRLSNPIARTINELISPKQINLIKKLAAEAQLDPEEICQEMYHAGVAEISRRAASALIERLQAGLPQGSGRSSGRRMTD